MSDRIAAGLAALALIAAGGCGKSTPETQADAASVKPEAPPADAAKAPAADTATAAAAPDGPKCTMTHYGDKGVERGHLTMSWHHEIWCVSAEDGQRYSYAIPIDNPNDEDVTLTKVFVEKLTPRPVEKPWIEKVGPLEESLEVTGLPITIPAKGQAKVPIAGTFVMDTDPGDASKRVNMHLVMEGAGATSGKPVRMRASAHMLGADEPELTPKKKGGPPWKRPGGDPRPPDQREPPKPDPRD